MEDERLRKKITEIYAESDGVYGSRKVRDELLELGFCAGRHRIARLMRELGLEGCPKKRYRVTTHSNHRFRIAPNHLDRKFTAEAPNQRWVADITYTRTQEGWLYLATVMDLYSMAIVGWSTSGTGSCYDSAAMESWFELLKRERANKRRYRTRAEARRDVFDYIERFYNRRRPHGSAGRMSPLKYEQVTLNETVR